MALNAKVIGIGAAGNKAAINLIEKEVVGVQSVLLLNSTLKDIPEKYKEYAIEFGDTKGCGKERNLAKKMIMTSLHEGKVPIDSFMSPEDKMVIIVTSSEGGTGCGASSIIAEYMKEVIKTNVHMFVFTGFEDDVRGLKNTVDWFNDLSDKYVVQAISNKKFLDECEGNRSKAELLANDEFATRIAILLGNEIQPSENNIDDTDLYKLTTTPGFMTIETCNLGKIRDKESFNSCLEEMIENSKSLDTEQSAKRIGFIFNGGAKTEGCIDSSFNILKRKYGNPFELFTHYQNVQDDEYVSIIVSGMKMPIDDIKDAYNKYKKQIESVDRTKDKFFDAGSKFDTSLGDELNIDKEVAATMESDPRQVEKAKSDFFSKYSFGNKQSSSSQKVSDNDPFENITKNEL